jgi:hypothetical protein
MAPLVLALLSPIIGNGVAWGQSGALGVYGLGGLSPLTVALGCRVENEKVLVITNTSAGPIAAGAAITYDAIRKPDHAHYDRVFQIGSVLAPGGAVRVGAVQSFSCTAWFRRVPTAAPSRN